jgi:hypothetical protein
MKHSDLSSLYGTDYSNMTLLVPLTDCYDTSNSLRDRCKFSINFNNEIVEINYVQSQNTNPTNTYYTSSSCGYGGKSPSGNNILVDNRKLYSYTQTYSIIVWTVITKYKLPSFLSNDETKYSYTGAQSRECPFASEIPNEALVWVMAGDDFNEIRDNITAKLVICGSGLKDPSGLAPCKWGLEYPGHSFEQPVDVYINPKALAEAQAVTNPGIALQRWLNSAEGRLVRSLKSKAFYMQGTFATAEGYVLKAQEITQDFTSFMNLLNQPVDAVTTFAETLVTTLKVLRVFIKIGTRIPYAKVVCKPIEKVMKVAIKLLDKGKKTFAKRSEIV